MSLSWLTGFSTGATLVASGTGYGSGFTAGNAIQAGDLIIVTLLCGGAAAGVIPTAVGMSDNLGAGGAPWTAIVPVTTSVTGSTQWASMQMWTKRAVGGETTFTPTFTQTTHTRNSLTVDVIRGSEGLATIDPNWVGNSWTTGTSNASTANDQSLALAMPSGTTATQSTSMVYAFTGPGNTFGSIPTINSANVVGGTATALTGGASTNMGASAFYLTAGTPRAGSTANVWRSWTTSFTVVSANVTLFEASTVVAKNPFGSWRRSPTIHQWIVNQVVTTATTGTNPAVTFATTGTNFQPGDILLFVVGNDGGTAAPTLVTDGFGNVAAEMKAKAASACAISLWGFVIPTGAIVNTNIGPTWTINQNNCSVIAYDLAGGTASVPMTTSGVPYFDTSALGSFTAATDSSGATSVTNGFGGEFILHGSAVTAAITAPSVTPSTNPAPNFRGFTAIGTPDSASASIVTLSSYDQFAAGGKTYNPIHSWTTSRIGASFTYALRQQITNQSAELDTTFSAVATATITVAGTGAETTTFTGSAAGAVTVPSTATTSITFTSVAAGIVGYPSTGELDTSFTSVASATITVPATGEADTTFNGTASGTVNVFGSGELDITVTTSAAGLVVLTGTGELDVAFTSEADATVSIASSANADVAFTGDSTATVTVNATGELDITFTSAGTATVSIVSSAGLDIGFVSSATATVKIPATGELDIGYSSVAAPVDVVVATGELDIGFTGVAAGQQELPGTGTLNVGFISLATATVSIDATAELDIAFTDLAAGAVHVSGTGELDIAFEGVASVNLNRDGSGELDIAFESLATYSVEDDGEAAFGAAFTSLAVGTITIPATGELQIGFGSSAANRRDGTCTVDIGFTSLARGAWVTAPAVPFVEQGMIFGVPAILEVSQPGPGQDRDPANSSQPVATQTFKPGNGPWPPA
jgi:hypothetical protein